MLQCRRYVADANFFMKPHHILAALGQLQTSHATVITPSHPFDQLGAPPGGRQAASSRLRTLPVPDRATTLAGVLDKERDRASVA